MRFKNKKMNPCKRTITIKRAIIADESVKKFIFTNSNYRRKVWNDFVREYYRCKDDKYIFNVIEFKKKYFHEFEEVNNIYESYVVGISEQVMKDMMTALKLIKIDSGDLKFKKFDRFRCSFKVHARPRRMLNYDNSEYLFNSRVYVDECNQLRFRVRSGEFIKIYLNEPIYEYKHEVDGMMYYFTKNSHYAFSNYDIKEISFVHELGKFYICLTVEVFNLYDKKKEITKRKNKAGIDLGIHNPVCITDEDNTYVLRMSNKELNRIIYLENRMRKLQSILERKTNGSKNYYKLLRKFRVTWYKIRNIRLNWRRKLSKKIATLYKKICVDTYKIPGKKEHVGLQRNVIKKLNYYNRLAGMYLLSEQLKYSCYKYKTKYYESPDNTTITCSKCGHVNKPIHISERYLKCEECGFTVDRDINASVNCYVYIYEKDESI